ncbi:MAG: tRNA (adenine(22)-N(1))-methyltransferase [Candidatus Saccharibacteria bacterium]
MKKIKLPKRIKAIADLINDNKPMADIGADHALLPCYLTLSKIIPRAIVGELTTGPYARACSTVRGLGLETLVEVRQGDGLSILQPGEVSTVVMAGMGGNTISEILLEAGSKAETFNRLILQPQNAHREVRTLIAQNGWPIIDERIVFDNDFYSIIVVALDPIEPYFLTDIEALFGPCILRRTDEPVNREYIQFHIDKYERIKERIQSEGGKEAQQEKQYYMDLIERLEEVLR